jgi:di/tricarboxylate transporter
MGRSSAGTLLVALGVLFVLAGVLVRAGGLAWFGKLPGDIRIERPSMRLYVPITSALIVSFVLSIAASILSALARRGR